MGLLEELDRSCRLQSPPDVGLLWRCTPASSPGPETLAGHHKTQRPQAHGSHPAYHAWREGENGFPGKLWKEWKLRGCRLFCWKSQRSTSDVRSDSVTQEMISQKGNAGFQLLCAHVKIARLLRSLLYLSAAFSPTWLKKKIILAFCAASSFFFYVKIIISRTRILGILHIFNFPFFFS